MTIKKSCVIKRSKLGAKGFHYPDHESRSYLIKAGAVVEELSYVASGDDHNWKPILVDNSFIENLEVNSGKSLYWILKKYVC